MEADIAYSITYVGHTPRSIFRWNLARIRSKPVGGPHVSVLRRNLGVMVGELKNCREPEF